jgi:hypothetical protein
MTLSPRLRDVVDALPLRPGMRVGAVEDAVLAPGEAPYDLAFACRVGVLDGRHPAGRPAAVASLRGMLVPHGPILVDTGHPLRTLDLREG